MVVIHAFFKVDSSHRVEFLEHAKKVAPPSQAEAGNISYALYEDTEHPNYFVMLEKWKDHAAIKQHEETSHFKNFVKNVQDILLVPFQAELYEVRDKH